MWVWKYPKLHKMAPTLHGHGIPIVPMTLIVIGMIHHASVRAMRLGRRNSNCSRVLRLVRPETLEMTPSTYTHEILVIIPMPLLVMVQIKHTKMRFVSLTNSNALCSKLLVFECPKAHVMTPTFTIHGSAAVPIRLAISTLVDHAAVWPMRLPHGNPFQVNRIKQCFVNCSHCK